MNSDKTRKDAFKIFLEINKPINKRLITIVKESPEVIGDINNIYKKLYAGSEMEEIYTILTSNLTKCFNNKEEEEIIKRGTNLDKFKIALLGFHIQKHVYDENAYSFQGLKILKKLNEKGFKVSKNFLSEGISKLMKRYLRSTKESRYIEEEKVQELVNYIEVFELHKNFDTELIGRCIEKASKRGKYEFVDKLKKEKKSIDENEYFWKKHSGSYGYCLKSGKSPLYLKLVAKIDPDINERLNGNLLLDDDRTDLSDIIIGFKDGCPNQIVTPYNTKDHMSINEKVAYFLNNEKDLVNNVIQKSNLPSNYKTDLSKIFE